MEPLRATPFKLNGLGKEQVLKLVWYGGNDGSANPIRFFHCRERTLRES